ncbi:MAG TPA: aldehyde dehydrogenase family protein [Sphingobium sp.]
MERSHAGNTYDVVNPATGQVFAQAQDHDERDLHAAITAAQTAFSSWSRDSDVRRRALIACSQAIRADAEALGRLLMLEQGKPLAKAVGEVMGAARWFEHTASLALDPVTVRDDGDMQVVVHRRPLGVVAGIAPWNYPVMTAAWKIAPALLAGNTIVLKPSPFTPLSTLRLGEIIAPLLPYGVVAIISGGDALGAALAAHPAIRKVTFTGSTAAGKSIASAAGQDIKRLTLELGGNDAAIVLDDADPDAIIEKLFWGAFQNSGQVCSAIKRLYIHESKFDAVVERLHDRVRRTIVGDGADPATELGPLTTRRQLETVSTLAADSAERGARILDGAAIPPGAGYFFAPTLVLGLSDDAPLVVREQFGPLLPILSFSDEAEVIERANTTSFGLSGSVWSGNVERATELAAQLECGTAWVNQHLSVQPDAPVSGRKWSGLGAENGQWGLNGFLDLQTVSVAKGAA